jgi:surfeit locus 1 family protein
LILHQSNKRRAKGDDVTDKEQNDDSLDYHGKPPNKKRSASVYVLRVRNMKIGLANWRLTLFSVFFGTFFLALSFWQVERGADKVKLLAAAAAVADLPGDKLKANLEVDNGDPVRLIGKFVPNLILLLDNKVLNGRVGYEVIQVFEDDSGVSVLVNRGFLAGGRTRAELPKIPAASSAAQPLRGHAYLTTFSLPDQNILGDGSPWVVQVIIPTELEKQAGRELFGYTIRLEESHPDALPRHWPVTIMQPERHYGYAVTWFLMALAVLGIFLYTIRQQSERMSE